MQIAEDKIARATEQQQYELNTSFIRPQTVSEEPTIKNITYRDCNLPITNIGLIETSSIFGSGIQIMGNVHNNHTHLVENLTVVAELYDEQNNLIGIENAGTPTTTPPLPSVQRQEHTPFKMVFPIQANIGMIGSVVFSCSYSIYDPFVDLDSTISP